MNLARATWMAANGARTRRICTADDTVCEVELFDIAMQATICLRPGLPNVNGIILCLDGMILGCDVLCGQLKACAWCLMTPASTYVY